MALHALENVEAAFDATREFLLPFSVRRWLKLALVAFFVGGTSVPTAQFNTGTAPDPDPGPGPGAGGDPIGPMVDVPPVVAENPYLVAGAVVAALVLLWAVFQVVRAVMEFVLVESLRSGDVTLRRYWSRRWGQGLRLFGFRLAIGLPMAVLFVGWLLVLILPLVLGGDPLLPIGIFFLGFPVVLLAGLVYWLVSTFTTLFVVPIMIREDSGVLAAWRRLWRSVRSETNQYLGFVVLWVVVSIVAGLIAALAFGILAVIVLLPLGLVALVTYLTVSFSTTLGLAVLAGVVALGVVALVVAGALVQVPVVSYLRYYGLLVLGDVEPDFDLVADRRRSATGTGTETGSE